MELKLSDIELAAQRIGASLHHTELDMSSTFSAATGGQIYLKCENRQKTGSFKIRGASNKIAVLAAKASSSPKIVVFFIVIRYYFKFRFTSGQLVNSSLVNYLPKRESSSL